MGEELFKSKILDDMFTNLNASFQGKFQKKYGENKYSKKAEDIIEKIQNILTENELNPDIIHEISFLIEDIQECEYNERFYWFKLKNLKKVSLISSLKITRQTPKYLPRFSK